LDDIWGETATSNTEEGKKQHLHGSNYKLPDWIKESFPARHWEYEKGLPKERKDKRRREPSQIGKPGKRGP